MQIFLPRSERIVANMDQNATENYCAETSAQYSINEQGVTNDKKEAYQFITLSKYSSRIENCGDGAIKDSKIIMTGSSDHENEQLPHPLTSKVT